MCAQLVAVTQTFAEVEKRKDEVHFSAGELPQIFQAAGKFLEWNGCLQRVPCMTARVAGLLKAFALFLSSLGPKLCGAD